MAVSANENGIKILANTDGIRLLRTFENLSYDASRTSEAVTKVALLDINFLIPHQLLINCLTCVLYLFQSTVSPISAAAAATSAGLSERANSVVTIAGMVCFLIISIGTINIFFSLHICCLYCVMLCLLIFL